MERDHPRRRRISKETWAALIGGVAVIVAAILQGVLGGHGTPPEPVRQSPASEPTTATSAKPEASRVVLDNKKNCVVLDHLAGVARVDLPPKPLSMQVETSGSVGEDSPVEVAVTFKNGSGILCTKVEENGSVISAIDGRAPLLAFIPDRESTLDNNGFASLTFREGEHVVKSVRLDVVRNAVLLDQLPEAESIFPPANGYRVLGSGWLGSPFLPPEALVSYRDLSRRGMHTVALRAGDRLADIDSRVPLVAVVPDWYSRDDNTGITVLMEASGPIGAYDLLQPLHREPTPGK